MTMDDTDEKVTPMDADSCSSRVLILVRRDPQPLRFHIEPTRIIATVLIAIGCNDDRIVR